MTGELRFKTREALEEEFEREHGDRPLDEIDLLLREYALRGEAPPLEVIDRIRFHPKVPLTDADFEEAKRNR